MSAEHEIAIISVGYKKSPFIKEILRNEIIPYNLITNNSSDFQIHHADPSKILFYSLEFTNLIDIIAQKSMDSLAVFETLGQFFEFYNPLHLSTLNYLISKYATTIKPETRDYLKAWKEITSAIFEDEFIFPMFEETRILHIKRGDVEVPVRQFIMSELLEKQKENSKNNNKAAEQALEEITGIIDLDVISKMKLCSEASKKIISAAAVLIVPTDIVSLFILFQSASFKETLQKTSGKIAFISPFWTEHELDKVEKLILEKTDFEPNLTNVVKLVKNYVDTVIIDDKDTELVATLRDEGITVLVEDLLPEKQSTNEFLDMVLKSVEISLDNIAVEPKGLVEGLGEKLVNLFRVREPKKVDEQEEDLPTIEISAKMDDQEIIESLLDEEITLVKDDKDELEIIEEDDSVVTAESNDLTDEFEMEIIDTQKEIPSIPTPPKESLADSDLIQQKTDEQFVLPGIDQITQFELEELDSLDVDEHIITSFLERAMISNTAGIEVVFSDLLSLQNNPLLIDKIYQMIMKKLLKAREINPEEKIADMITYLSAHKPVYYSERIEELLEETINAQNEEEFYHSLRITVIIIRSSLLIAGEVVEKFLFKHVITDDIYLEDKLRRIINSFSVSNIDLMQLVSKVLVQIYSRELEKEEPNEAFIDRVISFITQFDGLTIGISLITQNSDLVRTEFMSKVDNLTVSSSFKTIVTNILDVYMNGTYEKLLETLYGRTIPESIELEMMKRKIISSLTKVGSIPLEIFSERVGLPEEKAEKVIYDMILREEIPARIELVSGRLYIVQEQEGIEDFEDGIAISEDKEEILEDKSESIANDVIVEEKAVATVDEEISEEIVAEEFICDECHKSFKTERGLKTHKSRMHKKEE